MKHAISNVQDLKQLHIDAMATFLLIFGAHRNILFIIRVEILVVMKWSYIHISLIMLDNEI